MYHNLLRIVIGRSNDILKVGFTSVRRAIISIVNRVAGEDRRCTVRMGERVYLREGVEVGVRVKGVVTLRNN